MSTDDFNAHVSTLAERLKAPQAELPFITASLDGIGGVIKVQPDHFEVEEILPYQPCGEGEHLFVKLRRSGWNTADVGRALAEALGLKINDIGWGGRKDKQARTTQTFSLPMPLNRPQAEVEKMLAGLPFELLEFRRHRNKLKTGHVAGNRFRILLCQVNSDSLEHARTIADALRTRGLPNFFGEQRFGVGMQNLERAAALALRPRSVRSGQGTFIVSALQGALFNMWLKDRVQQGDFERIVAGDIAQKTDTGGLFRVDQPEEANQRLRSGAITYTGPLYGFKMMAAEGIAGERETAVLLSAGLSLSVFKPLRAPGTRRKAVLHMPDLVVRAVDQGLEFSFSLPSGAYATTVMREFMRPPQGRGMGYHCHRLIK
jgi:tRNA pseudouridine13 synthase